MKLLAPTGFALALTLMSGAVQADIPQAVAQTCVVELKQLCAGKTDSEFRQCVQASTPNLSTACKQALADAGMKAKDIKPADMR